MEAARAILSGEEIDPTALPTAIPLARRDGDT
jgi:hypothetical protein